MKDEEMAEQYAQNLEKELMKEYEEHLEYGQTPYLATIPIPHAKQAFLAGLKAGRPQWHDLRKQIPTENKMYLVAIKGNGLAIAYFNGKHWETKYNLGDFGHCVETVIAWCEIPTFDKE